MFLKYITFSIYDELKVKIRLSYKISKDIMDLFDKIKNPNYILDDYDIKYMLPPNGDQIRTNSNICIEVCGSSYIQTVDKWYNKKITNYVYLKDKYNKINKKYANQYIIDNLLIDDVTENEIYNKIDDIIDNIIKQPTIYDTKSDIIIYKDKVFKYLLSIDNTYEFQIKDKINSTLYTQFKKLFIDDFINSYPIILNNNISYFKDFINSFK
jgi:hypothetical protein